MTRIVLRSADRIAAAFLIGAGVLLVVILGLYINAQRLFVERYEYWTLFADGEGVAPGTAVKIAGIEVGKVRQVSLTDDDQVRVGFEVLADFADRIRQDPDGVECEQDEAARARCGSRVSVSLPAGLGAFLPSSGLSISVGDRRNPPVPPGGFVKSLRGKGVQDLLADLQNEGVVQNAQVLVEELAKLVTRVNDPEGPIWRSVQHVEAVTGRIQRGEGLVGEALTAQSGLQRQLERSLARLDRTLVAFEAASRDLAALSQDVASRRDAITRFLSRMDAVAEALASTSADLRVVVQGAKPVPAETSQVLRNLDRRVDDVAEILRGLKESFPLNLMLQKGTDPGQSAPTGPSPARAARPEAPALLPDAPAVMPPFDAAGQGPADLP